MTQEISSFSELFGSVVEIGNSFSSIFTLLAIAAAVCAYLSPWVLPSPLRDLVGDNWWTYGYFHRRDGTPVFYKERSKISHYWLWPWVLRVRSDHDPLGAKSDERHRYNGFCWYRSIYVYFTAHEPIFDDTTFEIYRRVMDPDNRDDFLVGFHMAKSYDETVVQCSVQIMKKGELVERGSGMSEKDQQDEETKEFSRLAGLFVDLNKNPQGLLLLQ